MQIFAQIVSLAVTAVALVLTTRAVARMVRVIRLGQPIRRTDRPLARTITLVKESLLHTRMLQWHWIGALHWFVYAAFLVLSGAVLTGYFQLFDPEFALPVIGHWYPYEWVSEFLGLLGTLSIIVLIVYRQVKNPSRLGRRSRFFGSTTWQAYFVEGMVLLESVAILFVRGAEYKLFGDGERSHFPISSFVGEALYPDGEDALRNIIVVVAMIKIVSAMVWLIVISSNLTMGVAWHRFTAWFNIWFKRESSGRTALGAMKPLTSGGKPVDLEDLEEMDEDTRLGVGAVEDFAWKGILDFTSCTECGRCQSQCPAWNTEKPLSPKLLVMGLREHAYAKAPYLQADNDEARAALPEATVLEAERPLVGATEGEWAWDPTGGAVIDDDVLWSCTSCGACVQQCPVDIEHVDHIMDMRRYQILVESNFPAELNGLFKGLENKGNPWNMSPQGRLDWAKDLPFEVKVVGEQIESLDEVEWLFWVGCAGAYEDRAKKTTRAVAELLHEAGVSFGVLGNGETCTGDPARRAGNEFVFQGLASQNAETFKETRVKKVVSTCAHCFNTLKNEYRDFGVELEVVHHTQLLNRLVREKKLVPVASSAPKRTVTYHDPCYLGRHNQVYSPPRELLEVLPGAEFTEMPRNSERSFCCGAGGARMWMEEKIGERINLNRTQEAVATGAEQIAVGCPFCRVMLSDGLTAEQAAGNAREEVEVLDVAQLLLASVKGETAQRGRKKSSESAAPASAAATSAAGEPAASTEPAAETPEPAPGPTPEPAAGGSLFDVGGDVPQEEPAEAPTPEVSAGGSLFDLGGDEPESAAPAKPVETAEEGFGGSLFDVGDDDPEPAAAPAVEESAADTPSDSGEAFGGSLFDIGGDEQESAPTPEPTQAEAFGGSLFDIPADEPEPVSVAAEPEEAAPVSAPVAESAAEPDSGDMFGGSLFDIGEAAPEPASESDEQDSAEEAEDDQADAKPATGERHQPRTDNEIDGSGSLFDL